MKVRKLLERPAAFVVFVMLFAGSIFAGCGGDDKENIAGADRSGYEELDFHAITRPEGMDSFVLRPDGTVLGGGSAGKLYAYAKDGTGQQEVAGSGSPQSFFCMDGEKLYAYDYGKGAVVELTGKPDAGITTLEDVRVVTDAAAFHTIRNMVALDGKVYVLAVPLTKENAEEFYSFGAGEYEDYGVQVYCIDAESGEFQVLGLENVTAEYRSEDGRLFFYGWEEERYYLYEYDVKKEKVAAKITFGSMGNLLNVVVEGGYLFGISASEGLVGIDLKSGEKEILSSGMHAILGNDLQFYRGNLYVNHAAAMQIQRVLVMDANGEIRVFGDGLGTGVADGNLGDGQDPDHVPGDKTDVEAQPTEKPKRKERIAVSALGYLSFNTQEIQRISGMRTKQIEQSFDLEALVAELMAGNPAVDIYLFPYSWPLTQRIKELGLYEPLNDSEIISGYLGKCFGYIQTAATNDNGDIWMVPVEESCGGTWYIPENMEKFGVSPEELCTLDSYIGVLERIHDKLDGYHYFNNANTFMELCDAQYDAYYNDYETGEINFDTELYRNMAEFFWPNWDRYGSAQANHPLFFKLEQLIGNVKQTWKTPDFDRDKVIFKTIVMNQHLVSEVQMGSEEFRGLLEGWRVLPFPKFASESEKNLVGLTYAYINPYSKQKAAAIEYLETVLDNQVQLVKAVSFFREDMEYYEPYYNTSLPAFQDIYDIHKNSDVMCGYSWDLYTDYITDYQRGLITFDEAIERRQRKAVTGLYE